MHVTQNDQRWTAFDGYVDRLLTSDNEIERNSILCGFHPVQQFPILLDRELLFEHFHMIGATGIGKTALGLSTLAIQLIRRGDGPVIIIDCKGDNAFFNTVRIETERAGRVLKWFTNKPNRSTFTFNPFLQQYLDRLSLSEIVGLFMQTLNLHHGDDYGRAWFSMASRMLFQRALQERAAMQKTNGRIESFKQLEAIIRRLSSDSQEFKAAQHLAFVIQSLTDFDQLNLSPFNRPDHPALRHAIHMPDVLKEKQVVYFSLVGAIDIAAVAEIARLVVYSVLSAAMAHRDQYAERPNAYLICDEAQTIIAQNISNVLAQAREFGVAFILAHQSMSQLNPPGGVDLRDLVLNCTCVKQIFSARDPVLQRYISDISGEVGYFNSSWKQFAFDVVQDDVHEGNAVGFNGEEPLVTIHSEIGPRLGKEDIRDVSLHPNQSIMTIERTAGYSVYTGAFPVHTSWPVGKKEYEDRNFKMPWPGVSEKTIQSQSYWPAQDDQTMLPLTHPKIVGPADDKVDKDLDAIKRKLGAK